MEILIFKIVVIILLIRVIALIIEHLLIVFYNKANKIAVNQILEDPEKYVRYEHMCKFMNDMIWVMIFINLLVVAFKGNLTIN